MEIVQLPAGRVHLPSHHPRAGTDYPLLAYLIRHPSGPILVDTGAGPGHDAIDSIFRPEPVDLSGALANAGVNADDVVMVINSHLHFDHIGGNQLFPGRPLVAQEAEYAAARRPRYTVLEWVDFPGAMWQLVSGDVEVAPGVKVMLTPSHTAGHQAVIVDAGDRVNVIAGQALHNCGEFETGDSSEPDEIELEPFDSVARRIKALDPVHVWFSHDPQPWPC